LERRRVCDQLSQGNLSAARSGRCHAPYRSLTWSASCVRSVGGRTALRPRSTMRTVRTPSALGPSFAMFALGAIVVCSGCEAILGAEFSDYDRQFEVDGSADG